ncbi:MAG: 30S ribosome-binding factor RbfA [Nitrospinae bacterium]|nr:30S ribosome-binding factor RbfA [Nitrospinota bacterium]
MKRFHRADRVGEETLRDLSHIIQREMKDPRLGFVSITRVEMAKDLRHANVFVSVFGPEKDKQKTMEALKSGAGFIRGLLGKRLNLRATPELTFHLDDSMEHSARIQELLRKVKKEEEPE